MDKKSMSERDICTKFITPAIVQAGWDLLKQVREEFSFTKGRIVVRGKLHTTNMILHGIEVPSQIRHDNTLTRTRISLVRKGRVDCVVANPPFGDMEENGIKINLPVAFRTRETADLFLAVSQTMA
jgi:hypothetical protein